MTIGNRIIRRQRKISASMVDAFRGIPVACVSDSMSRLFAAGANLRPMHTGGVLAGPALTVRGRPGDNLMLHKAIDMAEPGDVIVFDGGGDVSNAVMGGLMLSHAKQRGIAGFVLNAAVRDAEDFLKVNLPTYATGVTHRGPYKDGPGEINTPIAFGGMVIESGDLIVGDRDGVICVPFDDVAAVREAAQRKHDSEQTQFDAIEAGKSDRRWVDEALARTNCTIDL